MSSSNRSAGFSPRGALAYVKEHGVVLESARGPVPALAHAVAGGTFRGSWWSHPKGREIFRATRAVRDSPDVVVCRLIDGKITYVHRVLWPALVRLASFVQASRLAAIREVHTPSGAHRLVTVPFPGWVPQEIELAAQHLSEDEAREQLGEWFASRATSERAKTSRPRRRSRR
jgi:hypothetical protein